MGRSSQSESRSALGSETPSIWSVSRVSDGVDRPRNPATICVSNTAEGTAPHAAMSTSRSCDDAWATAVPGPLNTSAQGGGVHGERVDQGHPVPPGDLDQRQVGNVGALGVELGVEAVALLVGQPGHQVPQTLGVDDHDRGRLAHRTAPTGRVGPTVPVIARIWRRRWWQPFARPWREDTAPFFWPLAGRPPGATGIGPEQWDVRRRPRPRRNHRPGPPLHSALWPGKTGPAARVNDLMLCSGEWESDMSGLERERRGLREEGKEEVLR